MKMKKKMKGGSFIEPSKRLQFGDVISGSTSSSRKPAKEGDKTYSKAVPLPEGATTDKSSRTVYDSNGKRIGRRVAASTPKYVPDERNAGSRSKQAADYINRSRGKTKAEMERERSSGTQPAPRRSAQPDGPPAPSRPSTRTPSRPSTPTAKPPMAKAAPLQRKETKSVEGPAVKKQGVQARSTPSAAPSKSASSEGSGNKRIDRIKRKAEKKVSRIQDRRSKKENVKAARAGARAIIREAKGKPVKMQQGYFKDTST